MYTSTNNGKSTANLNLQSFIYSHIINRTKNPEKKITSIVHSEA
jgi:hypothetical protein